MADQVKGFLERRPYYREGHVQEMYEGAAKRGIPWCATCKDWHRKDEEHSED